MKALIMHDVAHGEDRKALIFLPLGAGYLPVFVFYDQPRIWFGEAAYYSAWMNGLRVGDGCLSEIELPDEIGADLLTNDWNGPDHVREDYKENLMRLVLAHRQMRNEQAAAIIPGQMTLTEISVKHTLRHLMG